MLDLNVQHRRFRHQLQALMEDQKIRPFVCDGSPLTCRVLIVGFNPATELEKDFWEYWSDEEGFDKHAFMQDYVATRKLKGARPRMQAIADQFPWGWCLETNICSKATRRAADLRKNERRTLVFRFLFEAVKPELVFLHSNDPIAFFLDVTGLNQIAEEPVEGRWGTHPFLVSGRPGPLWRMKVEDASGLGRSLADHLFLDGDDVGADDLALPIMLFSRRFDQWRIRLPKSDVRLRRPGKLAAHGWFIKYSFGSDVRGSFLDYHAEHRMVWGEERVRLHADGQTSTPSEAN